MGDAVGHGPWLQYDLAAEAALPDQRITVHEQIAEGDKVVSRWTLQGTNTMPFLGKPATGNSLTLGAIVIDVVRDGTMSSTASSVTSAPSWRASTADPPAFSPAGPRAGAPRPATSTHHRPHSSETTT